MNRINNIRYENFDVWLFAVDLVNFVFLKCSKLPPQSTIYHCPNFICKHFSEILQRAVQLIKDSVKHDVEDEFVKFQQQNNLRPETYTKYGKELRQERFSLGFDPEIFLHYSVHMAFLAHRFYNNGVRKAQIAAVYSISEDFQEHNVKFGTWEAFHQIAAKLVYGTVGVENFMSRRLAEEMNCFASPEMEPIEKTKSCEKKMTGDSKDCRLVMQTKYLLDSHDLSKPKFYTGEVSHNSCRRLKCRIKEHHVKEHRPMPSLQEALETSLERLSTSSPIKSNKNGSLHSSSAETDFAWKSEKHNRRTPKRLLERQIFRLSPSGREELKYSPRSNVSFT